MDEEAQCPVCGGEPGAEFLRIQTLTYQDTELIRGRDRYLLRTRDLLNLCAGCAASISRGRWIADFVCLVPLVVLFLTGVFLDSKPVMACLLIYLIYLARRLDYGWADGTFYGNDLERRLAGIIPAGDPGSTTFPTNWGHVAVRILAIPVGMVALASVGGVLTRALPRSTPTASAAAAKRAWPKDRLAHAKLFFEGAEGVVVPVSLTTDGILDQTALESSGLDLDSKLSATIQLGSFPMGGQPFMRMLCYETAAVAPEGTTYYLMSGGQLARAFLATKNATLLFVAAEDGTALVLYRLEVERLARALPATAAAPRRVYRKPR